MGLSSSYAWPSASQRSLARNVSVVLLGSLALTASSYVQVPMVPVPVTMQTLAVAMVGALLGPRLGVATVLAWLAQAMAGLPVLAGGADGLHHFAGPTAGYLAAFPLMAWLCGWLAMRGWNGLRPVRTFAGMMAANLLCLAMGWAWLAGFVGPAQAMALGVVPFLVGAVLKSALGAALLAAYDRFRLRDAA